MNGTPLKGTVIAMCQAVNLNYNILAKRIHKEITIGNFHRCLNKVLLYLLKSLALMTSLSLSELQLVMLGIVYRLKA